MSFQWPISMKLRAKTSRRRQHRPSEFISKGSLCLGAGVPTRGPEAGGLFQGDPGPLWKSGDSKRACPHQASLSPTSTVAGHAWLGMKERESLQGKQGFRHTVMRMLPTVFHPHSVKRDVSPPSLGALFCHPYTPASVWRQWFRLNGAVFRFWSLTLTCYQDSSVALVFTGPLCFPQENPVSAQKPFVHKQNARETESDRSLTNTSCAWKWRGKFAMDSSAGRKEPKGTKGACEQAVAWGRRRIVLFPSHTFCFKEEIVEDLF